MNTAQTPAPRWPVAITAVLVASIAVIAFGMSFVAMRDVMERAGFPGEVAWGLPVLVDGTIVAAMIFLFARRVLERRDRVTAWALLIGFSAISVVCNGVHTGVIYDPTRGISLEFAIFLGMLPPVGLLGSSELLVRLLSPARTTSVAAVPAAPVAAGEAAAAAGDRSVTAGNGTGEAVATTGDGRGESVSHIPTVAAEEVTLVAAVATSPLPIADEAASGDQVVPASAELLPIVAGLHAVEPLPTAPTAPAEQIEWVIERAREGHDVSWRSLMDQLDVSDRQAQRRLTEARKKAPDAFAA